LDQLNQILAFETSTTTPTLPSPARVEEGEE
jgi:hypothetical protein